MLCMNGAKAAKAASPSNDRLNAYALTLSLQWIANGLHGQQACPIPVIVPSSG